MRENELFESHLRRVNPQLLAGDDDDGPVQKLSINDPLDDGSAGDQSKTPWDAILNFLTSKPLETTAKVGVGWNIRTFCQI